MTDERCRVNPGWATEAGELADKLEKDGRHLYRADDTYEITRDGRTEIAGLGLSDVRGIVGELERLAQRQADRDTEWQLEAG